MCPFSSCSNEIGNLSPKVEVRQSLIDVELEIINQATQVDKPTSTDPQLGLPKQADLQIQSTSSQSTGAIPKSIR